MSANPVELIGGLTTSSNVAKADMVAWAKARVPQVMADANEVRNTTLAGQMVIFVKSLAGDFRIDTSDTTTADDGITCILSADGYRFKSDGSDGEKPIFLLGSGQSNPVHELAHNWTPNPRAFRWNNPLGGVNGMGGLATGTAFAPISGTIINVFDKLASDIADATGRPVYLLNVSFGGIPIDQWLSGASSPDMFAGVQSMIVAAMAAAGVTTIERFAWWEGESSNADTAYVTKFNTLMARLWADTTGGSSWFPQETSVLIFGIAPTSISGDGNSDPCNLRLIQCAGSDPDKRRFVYTGSLAASGYWADTLHMSAAGYYAAGRMACDVFLNGAGRNSVGAVMTDPVTARATVGRFSATYSIAALTVNNNAFWLPRQAFTYPPVVQAVGFDGQDAVYDLDSYAGASKYVGSRANGTMLAPTAVLTDNILVSIGGQGYDGAAYTASDKGYLAFKASQNWAAGVHGTYGSVGLTFGGTDTTVEVFRFLLGAIQINGTTSGSLTLNPPAVAGAGSQITFPAGTTDFSATGGASRVVKQTGVGAAFTVAQLASTDLSDRAAANGAATLDGSGKLTASQIPASLVGAVVYQGTWNATTNSPALASGTGTKGFYYKVATAGTTAIDGNAQWGVGDTIIFDGTTWDKIDGIANEVISVAGLFGVITSAALKAAMSFVVGDLTDASANARTFLQAANYAAMKVALAIGVADVAGAAPLASPAFTGTVTIGGSKAFSAANAVFNNPVANPTGTASATAKMMGLGATCTITPVNSTRVKFEITGHITSNIAGSGGAVQLAYGSGTAPANGTGPSGTAFGSAPIDGNPVSGGSSQFIPFTVQGIATGLTIGTAYWFDVQLAALISGTASIQSLNATAHEV